MLTGAEMWLTSLAADSSVSYYHVNAAVGAVFVLAMLAVLAAGGLPPGRMLWIAAAPTLAVYAFLNWDPLPTLMLTAAVVAHGRGRDALSGVAAGLGVAAKLIPGVIVPLVVAARLAQGRRRDAFAHAAAAGAAWLVVNLPVIVLAPEGWRRFFELSRERPANWDSLWYLGQQPFDASLPIATINAWSGALFLGGAVAIGVIGARRRDPAEWWQLTLPLLCWFLLVNKVYSPQYSLWLLPLLALTLPRLDLFVAFAVTDLAVFLVEFPFLGGQVGAAGAPGLGAFAFVFVLRTVVLLWIVVGTVRGDRERVNFVTPPVTKFT